MNYLKGFALAFNMLSIIPFFKVHHFFDGINGYSAMFYPLVGFILGSFLYGFHLLISPFFPSLHEGVLVFTLWVIITGAIHLDGLSDTIDGLFVSKEKALGVMKDSHVGGMGMLFSATFLLLKLSSLLHLQNYALLPFILMLSRFNAISAIYFFPYVSSGVGSLLKKEFTWNYFLIAFVFTTSLVFSYSSFFLLFLALSVVVLVGVFFTRRLGGLSGDIYGFLIELSEVVFLNYFIVSMAL